MRIDERCELKVTDTLYEQLGDIIFHHPDITHKEALLALAETIGTVLLNIDCPDCRRLSAKLVKEMMPRIVRDAMTQAAKQDCEDGKPPRHYRH
jgi:hypothetical protein